MREQRIVALIPVPIRLGSLATLLAAYAEVWPDAEVGEPNTYGVTPRVGPGAGETTLMEAIPVTVGVWTEDDE